MNIENIYRANIVAKRIADFYRDYLQLSQNIHAKFVENTSNGITVIYIITEHFKNIQTFISYINISKLNKILNMY